MSAAINQIDFDFERRPLDEPEHVSAGTSGIDALIAVVQQKTDDANSVASRWYDPRTW